MKKHVELVANIAIIIVCCLIGYTIVMGRESRPASAGRDLQGNTLPQLSGYNWAAHPRTLVLAVRTGCGFCEASLPFYKSLSTLESDHTLHAHLLAVIEDDQKGNAASSFSSLPIQKIPNAALSAIRVRATPTLLLVDSHGKVLQAWVGELSRHEEGSVLAAAEK